MMQTKKKKSKSAKNKEKEMEKQVEKIEKVVKVTEKLSKEEKEKKKKEEQRKKQQQEKVTKMREDLQKQLIDQNKFGAQFDDIIEHYLFDVCLIDDLEQDIKDNGIRYEVQTGNGYTTKKPNESIKNIPAISSEMRKILQDLNLKEPEVELTETEAPEEGEGDDLL